MHRPNDQDLFRSNQVVKIKYIKMSNYCKNLQMKKIKQIKMKNKPYLQYFNCEPIIDFSHLLVLVF